MLDERRREIQAEVQGKMRDVRAEGTWGGKLNEVLDAVESSEADIQEDIEFALIQMKSETLNKVNDALARLEQGNYGNCFDVRRRNRREAPAGAAVRGPLQGLRGSARESPSSASVRCLARRGASSLFLGHVRSGVPRGSAGGGAHFLPHHRGSFVLTPSDDSKRGDKVRSP